MFMVVTCSSSSSWMHSTAMPLSRLVRGGLWQPSQDPLFLSQEWVPKVNADASPVLLTCCRCRPFLDSREPALLTASIPWAAQCRCENKLWHLLSLSIAPRLSQKHVSKVFSSLFPAGEHPAAWDIHTSCCEGEQRLGSDDCFPV